MTTTVKWWTIFLAGVAIGGAIVLFIDFLRGT